MKPTQSFNSGLVRICGRETTGAAGYAGADKIEEKCTLRYQRRTIGMQRGYLAAQAKETIDLLIRCPYRPAVLENDIAMPGDGAQYKIKKVQVIESVRPLVMDLTLERLSNQYEVVPSG